MLWSEVWVLMCGKPELLDRCCVHQTRGLSVFGNSRQRRDAVQALPRRHAWVVTGVLHTSPCGVRGRQSVAGESLRGRVAAVLIAVRVGSGRRGWPPFCGIGERRAEIVPQGGGRRHQTTGWHGGLMAVSRGREGRAPRNVRPSKVVVGTGR